MHIVVNDGGDKEVLESGLGNYLRSYQGRLQLIHNGRSLGVTPALNAGMIAAHSDYVITHDDDDSWELEFLEKAIGALKLQKQLLPNTRGIMSHTTAIHEYICDEEVIEKYRYSFNGWVKTVALTQLSACNFIPPISFLFERGVFAEIGHFNEALPAAEDWEFYLRFLSKFDIAVLPEHLANYHVRAASTNLYGNTVVAGIARHRSVGAAIRNELIRQDIKSGKVGLGFLVALSSSSPLQRFRHRLWGVTRQTAASLAPKALLRSVWRRRMNWSSRSRDLRDRIARRR